MQAGTDTPDRLTVALDRLAYRSGDMAQVHGTAERDAVAIVSVLSNQVSAMKIVPLTTGENTIAMIGGPAAM